MRKHPFLAFMAILGVLVFALVGFIQSPNFARLLKRVATRYVPHDMGVDGDFAELGIQLFPPGVVLINPQVSLRKHNLIGLPEGSSIRAKRVELSFQAFQMFSGNIRVRRVSVIGGDIELAASTEPTVGKKKAAPKSFSLEDILQVHVDELSLSETHVKVPLGGRDHPAEWIAESLTIQKVTTGAGNGYQIEAAVRDIRGLPAPIQHPLDRVEVKATLDPIGVVFSQLLLRQGAVRVAAKGDLRGDLFGSRSLWLEATADLTGDSPTLLGLAGQDPVSPLSSGGQVVFSGKVRANLRDMATTLKCEGKLHASDLHLKAWEFDELDAEGAFAASAGGSEVTVSRVLASSREREREGSLRAATGGRIEAGPFKIKLGGTAEPSVIPVRLSRAHIHWLAAGALESVYGLTFRTTGTSKLTYYPPVASRGGSVGADLDLVIEPFQMDNQRLGNLKPLHKILSMARIQLKGAARVDGNGFYADGIDLSAGTTHLQVTGKIEGKTGYDLYGKGNVRLADFGELSQAPIRGDGRLQIHARGPTAKTYIDFDVDLANAFYLNLHLGELHGRITWDDDADRIVLTDVSGQQGSTRYLADGTMDVGKIEKVNLGVSIPEGTIQELSQIFGELHQGVSWYPHSLTGDVTGTVQLSGGLGLSELVVQTELKGEKWDFQGEKFRGVHAKGGYDRGRYYIDSVHAAKNSGSLDAALAYGRDESFSWLLETHNLRMSDFDRVARLDVPIRGNLELRSEGKGRAEQIESSSRLVVTSAEVRGNAMPDSTVLIKTSGGIADVQASLLGGQGAVELSYGLKPGTNSYLRAQFNRFDFSPALLLLNPKAIQDHALEGVIGGRADLTFKSGEIERASGVVGLSDYVLAKSGARFWLAHPASVNLDHGTFNVSGLTVQGNAGSATLGLRGRSGELEGEVRGDLDASIAEFLTPALAKIAGTVGLDLAIGGTLKRPSLFGSAEINNISVKLASLDSPLENVTGTLALRDGTLGINRVQADLASGRFDAQGKIDFFADKLPDIDLKATLSGNRLKIFPFQFVKVKGDLRLHGHELPYDVDGALVSDSALCTEKIMGSGAGQTLKTASYTPPPTSRQEGDSPRFRLGIDVTAERGILVQNDLFNAELKGNLKVINTMEAPRVLGTAQIIQGEMTFNDRSFQIQSASLNFDSPTVINPVFNLTATTEVSNNRIQLYAAGRLNQNKIELTSSPPLPESEILSLLALGTTSEDARKIRSADRGAVQQSEAASLLLHSLDFNRDIQNRTGFAVELDETVNNQAGSSIFKHQDDSTTAAPKIVIKRKIGKQVEVSAGSTVGVGTSNQKEFNAEYSVTPGFSVIGVWDELDSQQSYGFDLKLQKRFK